MARPIRIMPRISKSSDQRLPLCQVRKMAGSVDGVMATVDLTLYLSAGQIEMCFNSLAISRISGAFKKSCDDSQIVLTEGLASAATVLAVWCGPSVDADTRPCPPATFAELPDRNFPALPVSPPPAPSTTFKTDTSHSCLPPMRYPIGYLQHASFLDHRRIPGSRAMADMELTDALTAL
ncbi:hypothetical protein EX30DRAFT_46222 [Ascodesmis nigricans]|uniref:Uncharacterized protein n=1 Tax=Ascodesmis nigricans TaxID=341454 RepID=A0A4S2MVI7_9PEZI|nr:hypothetical protein EX30DRAFT_46222 [Ascodesmis nigricans]